MKKTDQERIEEFTKKAKNVHGERYDYSNTKYDKESLRFSIICKIHGEFWQERSNHLRGSNCKKCSTKRMETDEFIKESMKIFGDFYDYSKVVMDDGVKSRVKIICPIHGEFETIAEVHVKRGGSCRKCGRLRGAEKVKRTTDEYIELVKKVHGDKYSYELVDYKNPHSKVDIICPEHGLFRQTANDHYIGKGCVKCTHVYSPTNDEFIQRCVNMHLDKYDYSLVEYKSAHEKVTIICKIHGEFKQAAKSHSEGKGCQKCTITSRGENEIRKCLIKNNIEFVEQKTFDGCVYKNKLKFDFYLSNFNILIECDGEQHRRPVLYKCKDLEHAEKIYEELKTKDEIKNKFCEDNNIKLYRIPYNKIDKLKNEIENIIKEILNEN